MNRTQEAFREDNLGIQRRGPLNVATLIKNASGVQLTYRGAGILPKLDNGHGRNPLNA